MTKKIFLSLIIILFLTACTTVEQNFVKVPPQTTENVQQDEIVNEEEIGEVIVEEEIDSQSTTNLIPLNGAIIADHTSVQAFESIPDCWLEKAKEELDIGYQHTSHGSQIISGLRYLETQLGDKYALGLRSNELSLRDNAMGKYASNANDLGYSGWSVATKNYLKETKQSNMVMWSWCGQVGSHTKDMDSYLLDPAENIKEKYDVEFIYMTGHLDGSGPQGNVEKANNIIREHVKEVDGILFDFADIESYDPDGKYYPNERDSCGWCEDWCSKNPKDCQNLPSCAHSHGFNCVQKAKAYWWLMSRVAGWDGKQTDCS